jgi:hypothetical protein
MRADFRGSVCVYLPNLRHLRPGVAADQVFRVAQWTLE